MKKLILLFAMIAIFASCKKELNTYKIEVSSYNTEATFNILDEYGNIKVVRLNGDSYNSYSFEKEGVNRIYIEYSGSIKEIIVSYNEKNVWICTGGSNIQGIYDKMH